MVLQDEILAILSNTNLTPQEQAALLAALVTPIVVTPASDALTTVAPPSIGGQQIRIDPVVPADSPNTITMPATGHVLSLPLPSQGEGLMGYFQRTSLQTGGNPQATGGLIATASEIAGKQQRDTSPNNWPYIVDAYANPVAYMTPEQQAALAAAKTSTAPQLSPVPTGDDIPIPGATLVDLYYVEYANSVIGAGQGVWHAAYPNITGQQQNQCINIVGSTHAAEFAGWYTSGGVAAYAGPVKAAVDAYVVKYEQDKAEPSALKP